MRKSDGIRLHVRSEDGSRSSNPVRHGTQVPAETRNVGNVPTAEEVDRLFAWATSALLGDPPDVDVSPAVMERIRERRAS